MNFSTPPELAALEGMLSGLRPAASGVDRDRLMFLAGQASVAPAAKVPSTLSSRVWKSISTLTTAAAVVLAAGCWSLWQENTALRTLAFNAPSVPSRTLPDPTETASPAMSPSQSTMISQSPIASTRDEKPSGPATYLQLRTRIQQYGIEALATNEPVATGSQAPAATYESLLDEFQLSPRKADTSRNPPALPRRDTLGEKS
jgi:hypothetical protein